MDELEKELKEGFLQESSELLESTEQAFLRLETEQKNPELLNLIFRFAHNLKGTSRAVGFGQVAEFTHELENLILKLKEGTLPVTDQVVTLLLESNDHINVMISGLRENLDATFEHSILIEKIRSTVKGEMDVYPSAEAIPEDLMHEVTAEQFAVEHEMASIEEVVPTIANVVEESEYSAAALASLAELGINISDSDDFGSKANIPILPIIAPPKNVEISEISESSKTMSTETVKEISTEKELPSSTVQKANTEETIRVNLSKVSKLNDLVGELAIIQTVLDQMRYSLITHDSSIKAIGHLNKLSKEIQEIAMGLCMVPVKSTFQKLVRIVRDTSKALNKQVNLVIEGDETEIDKTVLEFIADPLVHIVRNAVDHGLESTEERIKAGKKPEGKVVIKAFYQGNFLAITVTDDGKGIDAKKIREKAIEKKVISANATLSEKELINLIFHPGFSTKEQVSEVSGRGVGMDVVKSNITKISGSVDIKTEVGKGSEFKILLPLTLAIIDGLVTKIGSETYIIPLDQMTESLSIKLSSITSISGVGECMNLRGQVYPLFKVGQKLNIKDGKKNMEEQIAIIVNSRSSQYAVVVDDIIKQQQVVIKKLGHELKKQQGLMGSTILGDGKPAFILDLDELFGLNANKSAA